METIGNEEYAEIVKRQTVLPDGWKWIGEGCHRIAFLGPDGVVYKKEIIPRGDNWSLGDGGNRSEYTTFVTLMDRGFSWIPQFHLFENDIIAVQRLADLVTYKLSPENQKRYQEIMENANDSGYRNTGLDESGLIFLRDGGHGSRSPRYY